MSRETEAPESWGQTAMGQADEREAVIDERSKKKKNPPNTSIASKLGGGGEPYFKKERKSERNEDDKKTEVLVETVKSSPHKRKYCDITIT